MLCGVEQPEWAEDTRVFVPCVVSDLGEASDGMSLAESLTCGPGARRKSKNEGQKPVVGNRSA